ncbi:MAG: amidohydrolase [Woeseiaceae bacterium]
MLLVAGLVACTQNNSIEPADLVFLGDHIITVDATESNPDAVAVRGERIVFVGSSQSVQPLISADTRIIKLGESALIPGFIDSHGHVSATARLMRWVNLSSPPVGTAESIDDVVELLRSRLAENPPADDEWLLGYGYDDSLLEDQSYLTRSDLDRVSLDIPIYVAHVSGHLGILNSAGLAAQNIDSSTENPPGGVIQRQADGEPNGVVEESAAAVIMLTRLGELSGDEYVQAVRKSLEYYASYGVTSVQDGAAPAADIATLREAANAETFISDISAYQWTPVNNTEAIESAHYDESYSGGFRVAGVKFALDGSPQGRTAWITEPYTEGPHNAPADYVAYPTVDPDDYHAAATAVIRREIPMIVHANGDAAIGLMLAGIESALADGVERDHRSVAIHAQLMRDDQLDDAARLGVVPSFFSSHTFFWGDWHLRSFGEVRGNNISPTRSAIDRKVHFTIHNDTPVVPPDMMRLLWATVARTTRSGNVIGSKQRLSVDEALHAATLGGAYQLFEEDNKGSITVGKQADLVILSHNPRLVDPGAIEDIAIEETFARGISIHNRRQDQ